MKIVPLSAEHDRASFDCGRIGLNDWLRSIARQHADKSLSRTWVAVSPDHPAAVLGYYALTLAEAEAATLPAAHRRRLPRRVPAVRLGRLAVDRLHQGKGLGGILLVDALHRARTIRDQAGAVGLFVDAVDESALAFYRRFGFEPLPDHPLMLFLPIDVLEP